MFFEIVNGADEFAGVLSNHLRNDRTIGGILSDRTEDVGIEIGVNMNAEVLRDVNIGSAKLRHDPHEGQVGHVLHGR